VTRRVLFFLFFCRHFYVWNITPRLVSSMYGRPQVSRSG
jgi:hypothetical protein